MFVKSKRCRRSSVTIASQSAHLNRTAGAEKPAALTLCMRSQLDGAMHHRFVPAAIGGLYDKLKAALTVDINNPPTGAPPALFTKVTLVL